jgi:hypothetical protein
VISDERGQARAHQLVERDLRDGTVGDRRVDELVARSGLEELLGVLRHGVDVDASPAPVVEGLGHRQVHRVVGADVDVSAVCDMAERPPEDDILAVLRVRDEEFRHGGSLTSPPACEGRRAQP